MNRLDRFLKYQSLAMYQGMNPQVIVQSYKNSLCYLPSSNVTDKWETIAFCVGIIAVLL